MTGRWRNRYFTATLRAAGGLTTTPALSAAALSVTVPALSRVTLELPLPLLDSGMAQDCPSLLVSVAMPGEALLKASLPITTTVKGVPVVAVDGTVRLTEA